MSTPEFTQPHDTTTLTSPEGIPIVSATTEPTAPSWDVPTQPMDIIDIPTPTVTVSTETSLVRVEHPDERLPESLRLAFRDQDIAVRIRLTDAQADAVAARERATIAISEVQGQSVRAIQVERATYDDEYAQVAKERDELLAAVNERFSVVAEKLNMKSGGIIAEHTRLIDAGTAFIDESTAIGGMIGYMLDRTTKKQSIHEAAREGATSTLDAKVERRIELEGLLHTAQTNLAEETEKRIGIEKVKTDLVVARATLRSERITQWDIATAPYKQVLLSQGFTEGTDEYNNALKQIQDEFGFPKVKEVEDKIDILPDEFETNKNLFAASTKLINEYRGQITAYTNELAQIQADIPAIQTSLDKQAVEVGPAVVRDSNLASYVVGGFVFINNDDEDGVSGMEIPNVAKPLWDKRVAFAQARAVVEGMPVVEWKEPLLNDELEAFLRSRLSDDDFELIVDGTEREQTRVAAEQQIAAVRHGIGADTVVAKFAMRGIARGGTAIEYVQSAALALKQRKGGKS
jgi:16S rRNA G527 N7-methylase RsmG